MDIKIAIGRKIRSLRSLTCFMQEELADRAGIDRTYITSLERGKRNISVVDVEKIAVALKVDISELFKFEDIVNTSADR